MRKFLLYPVRHYRKMISGPPVHIGWCWLWWYDLTLYDNEWVVID